MARRPHLNPLSVLFILGVLLYGLYTGVIQRPGTEPAGDIADEWSASTPGPEAGPDVRGDADQRHDVPVDSTRPVSADGEQRRRQLPGPSATDVAASEVLTGEVIQVLDGDTLEVLADRRSQRIRLFGIDAPERGQPYGRAAREQLERLCRGKTVYAMVLGKDRYGRILADVYVDTVWINGEMVTAGLAWWYKHYSPSPELDEREQAARQARLGLWKDARPIPPWEYRQANPRLD